MGGVECYECVKESLESGIHKEGVIGVGVTPFGFVGVTSLIENKKALILSWSELEAFLRKAGSRKKAAFELIDKRVGFIVSDSGMTLELLERSTSSNYTLGYPWNKIQDLIKSIPWNHDSTKGIMVNPDQPKVIANIAPFGIMFTAFSNGASHIQNYTWSDLVEGIEATPLKQPLPDAWLSMKTDRKVIVSLTEDEIRLTLYDKPTSLVYTSLLSWSQVESHIRKMGRTYIMDGIKDLKDALLDTVMKDPFLSRIPNPGDRDLRGQV
jgi:hypothetical protein